MLIFSIFGYIIALLAGVSALDYGVKVDVNGLKMNVGIFGEGNETNIVFLTGLGIISPVITYKLLAESLADKYRIIIIEPFGYGLSDLTKDERNVKNIISEYHTCVQKLGVKKYYLMAHSFGGIYSLAYSNEYSEEVLGYIGLDTTPRDFTANISLIDDIKEKLERGIGMIANKLGLMVLLPKSYKQQKDMEALEIILNYRFCNNNVVYEYFGSEKKVNSVSDLSFPDSIPTVLFLGSIRDNFEDFLSLHQEMKNANPGSETVVLNGNHCLFFEHKKTISDKIKSWIK
ncbi:alpha/beta-hydrolase [Piromyces finnis]|uniref:Alpha/beta-hydrolase n=1 Tax=Piromyces finnis TaxID=1754191 RepID=A0A1Y1VLF4_9FUNG|nr:alpha/beta-hydrolase [Piromyces finnis]|eukprot:ORX59113.1 alpha/beta-hydrolase [Piromyces finnis]